jgi:hypothetical protein
VGDFGLEFVEEQGSIWTRGRTAAAAAPPEPRGSTRRSIENRTISSSSGTECKYSENHTLLEKEDTEYHGPFQNRSDWRTEYLLRPRPCLVRSHPSQPLRNGCGRRGPLAIAFPEAQRRPPRGNISSGSPSPSACPHAELTRAGVFGTQDWAGDLCVHRGQWGAAGIARGQHYAVEGEIFLRSIRRENSCTRGTLSAREMRRQQ